MTDQALSRKIGMLPRRELLRIGATGFAAWVMLNFLGQPTPIASPAKPVAGVALGPPSPGTAPAVTIIDEPQPTLAPTAAVQPPATSVIVEAQKPTAIATARRQVEQAEVITDKGYIFMSRGNPPPTPIPDSYPLMDQVRLRKGAKLPLQYDADGQAIVFQNDWVLVNNAGRLGLVLVQNLKQRSDLVTELGLDKFNSFFAVDPNNFSVKRSSPENIASFLGNKFIQQHQFDLLGENYLYDTPDLFSANGIYAGCTIDSIGNLIVRFITKSDGQFGPDTTTFNLSQLDQNPTVFNQPHSEIKTANIVLPVDSNHQARVALLPASPGERKYIQNRVADPERLKLILDFTAALVSNSNSAPPLFAYFSRYDTAKTGSNIGTYGFQFVY